ncbi:uncharacterized protein EAF01_002099 [Botrytis porri]|uniref:Ecp2 effector protein domain-containing protein n=1 Tax=Botrytis porri TaxID=87229 RepID=A0A4Z1L6H4_9HELO|nr:uncharacterized protein EAF01_002099 [Botrytis porri]KAF7910588.1 hypothetical protein EAF01_002099 [Botrytis porri]TGO92266.1 hypothetical protein BPOR_0006g00060 [Botrytis porri]
MHFLKISSILTLCSTVFANQCYNHIEGVQKVQRVQKEELSQFASEYCQENWNKLVGDWTEYNDRSGNTANVGKVVNFRSKEVCIAAFSELVDRCHNDWGGGLWVDEEALLNVNFCKWVAEPKRVRYDALNTRLEVKRVAWDGLIDIPEVKRVRPDAPKVRYEGLREAKRVAWDGLKEASEAKGSKQTKPTAPRVRYQGPREAKRVAWDGLPGDHEHTAKRVGFQGLRLQSQDL